MLYLSKAAVDYAMAICASKPRYRVVIATATERDRDNIIQYIEGSHEWSPDRIFKGSNKCAEWTNGSKINITYAHTSSRGMRAHLVIADENINDEIINAVFRRIEILEQADRMRRNHFDDVYEHRNDVWTIITIPDNTTEAEEETDIIISEDELMKVLGIS